MPRRLACPPAPGPLEEFAGRFDDLFGRLAQRRAFREYLAGLLLPRDRNKTLTGLAGTEPVAGAQAAPAQRLQFFVSESGWEADAVNARRLELACAGPATTPREAGVLVIDDSGDRKAGTKTAHVARQLLGRQNGGRGQATRSQMWCGPPRTGLGADWAGARLRHAPRRLQVQAPVRALGVVVGDVLAGAPQEVRSFRTIRWSGRPRSWGAPIASERMIAADGRAPPE